jgi:hypothetical protein
LYNPLVALVTLGLRALGAHPLVLDVGAAVSALAAAVAAGGLLVVFASRGWPRDAAWTAAATLVLAGGVWQFATRLEVYTLAGAGVVLWLAVASAERPRPLAVGLALAAAILCHAALGLLALPTAWRLRRAPRGAALALVTGLAAAGAATGLAIAAGGGGWDPRRWVSLFAPPALGDWIGGPRPQSVFFAVKALVVWEWWRSTPVLDRFSAIAAGLAGMIALALAGALLVAGLFGTLRTAHRARRDAAMTPAAEIAGPRHRLASTAAAALLAFTPLWLFWDQGNVEHVVAAAPLFAVLLGAGFSVLRPLPRAATSAALVGCLFATNSMSAALQAFADNGRVIVTAGFVQRTVASNALILSTGRDARLRLGLGYISGRKVLNLALVALSAKERGRTADEALGYWLRRAHDAPEAWATEDVFTPEGARFVESLGVPPARWREVVAALHAGEPLVMEAAPAVVPERFALHRVSIGPG